MLSLFKLAFNLYQRVSTTGGFVLVSGCSAVAYLIALALFLLVPFESVAVSDTKLVCLGGVLFALGLYLQFGKAVMYRLAHAATIVGLNRVADGDLTLRFLPGWGKKLDGQAVWTEFNRMSKTFPLTIQRIRDSAQRIEHGSHEVAQGYADLSRRTEHQSKTLHDTSRCVQALAVTVNDNADNCRRAERIVTEVGRRADEAAQAMRQVTLTMGRIEVSTRKVVEFVGIVQNIALQTNILALNAAVEAACAGDQGHGFAVVADEVRSLASRSAEATGKIKALIASSSERVTEGSALVAEAERAFDAAAKQIGHVMGLIRAVAAASIQQSGGVQAVTQALPDLETVTLQSADLVQEGVGAAGLFEQTSRRLVEATRAFRLPEKHASEDEVTEGNFETTRRNIGLGPWLGAIVFLPMALIVSVTGPVGALLFALPLFSGIVMTYLAARSAIEAAGVLPGLATSSLSALAVTAFLIAIYLFFTLAAWQTFAARWMLAIASRLGAGDLTWQVAPPAEKSTGRMGHETRGLTGALFDIKQNFAKMVREVRASADSIATEAHDIARGYNDLALQTQALAGALEESAASIAELKMTVKHNADNCQVAEIAAGDVRSRSEQAARSMQRVTSTMTGIEQSALAMNEFVGVIEGIAFQTNILALNAAVEAARAGEQGRGFAVVSAEVRTLAQRSAQATDEVKGLIANSVQYVVEGAKLVREAEQTLNHVVAGVHEVVGLIGTISAASVEQSQGMQQISVSLGRLKQIAQQNAALVEEGLAASMSFEREGRDLAESVRLFRLEEEKGAPKAA